MRSSEAFNPPHTGLGLLHGKGACQKYGADVLVLDVQTASSHVFVAQGARVKEG